MGGAADLDAYQLDVELIYPATEQALERHRPKPRKTIKRESPEEYAANASKRKAPGWVAPILAGQKEADRVLRREPGFVLVADTNKWIEYPAASKFPYALAFTDEPLPSLRELRASHLPLLREIRRVGLEAMRDVGGVPEASVRAFFHYPPQFFHLHVHFALLDDPRADAGVGRAVLLDDVIDNLVADGEFYASRSLFVIS